MPIDYFKPKPKDTIPYAVHRAVGLSPIRRGPAPLLTEPGQVLELNGQLGPEPGQFVGQGERGEVIPERLHANKMVTLT